MKEVKSGFPSKPLTSGSIRRENCQRENCSPSGIQEGVKVELSARNQLKGEVVRVQSGAIMAEVEVKIEAGNVVAAITDGSLKRLNLKAGDHVTVIIKATEVLIGK